jgi:DNA-binding LytR/AlgR family response regulator
MTKRNFLAFQKENLEIGIFPGIFGNSDAYIRKPAISAEGIKRFIFIKSEYKMIKVMLDDILFCEGMKDYTQVFVAGRNQPVITLQNLKSFSEKLPANEFIRVHRSFIISFCRIDSISRNEIAIGPKLIPIGSSYRDHFFALIDQHS